MGNNSINERSQDITNMLNYGFANYSSLKVYSKGDVVDTLHISDAKNPQVPIIASYDIYMVVKKGERLESLSAKIDYSNTSSPLNENEVVGSVIIKNRMVGRLSFLL